MPGIHITDIEAAINHWRARRPAEHSALAPEVAALAEVYALMSWLHEDEAEQGPLAPAPRSAGT